MFLDAEEIRRKGYAEEEKKRRENEQQHEECMQYMFSSFMQQTMAMIGGQGHSPQPPYPPAYPPPAGYHQPTSHQACFSQSNPPPRPAHPSTGETPSFLLESYDDQPPQQ